MHRFTHARRLCRIATVAVLAANALPARAEDARPSEQLDRIVVTGPRPSSLPSEIPTTIESITREQIADRINATDAEDALKYFPSLIVRKRYIGDYDHAVLGSRASGTGNSARSLVYADGILLSNLLGNGATFTPRWGLVTPDEIERVDVLYGPFSAAYPGNSVGAVVDFVTRMPTATEAHARIGFFDQPHFRQYATTGGYGGGEGSFALGSRAGPFAWWVDASRIDSEGQPIVFANRLQSAGVVGGAGTPVTGAVFGQNPKEQNWYLLGSTTQTHTVQDHAKAKLSFDFTPEIRATYVFGTWKNESVRSAASYLHDAGGNPVVSGNVSIDGRSYALAPGDFAPTRSRLEHDSHGLSVVSDTRGVLDFAVNASVYAYQQDQVRTPTVAVPSATIVAPGTITDMKDSGWNTFALKATVRPDPAHTNVVEFGVQRDAFRLRTRVNATNDWIGGGPGALVSRFDGDTNLTSVWLQDAWRFAPEWKAIIGLRGERWTAHDGLLGSGPTVRTFAPRRAGDGSPKFAVGYTGIPDWHLKASVGRALRFPTVSELYQGAIVGNVVTNNDPNLRPERSWTSELTAERDVDGKSLRLTYFHERTHDALYSQTNVNVTPNVTNIQNVDRIRTNGFEVAATAEDFLLKGFELSGSVTRAISRIVADANFPQAVGKLQPRVPDWRANLFATWHVTPSWTTTVGIRYSGRQYGTLDNSDPNASTYTGFSNFLVVDAKVRYRFDPHWVASFGVDNLNNRTYWAFHPYPQRTFLADLGYDL